MINLSVAISGRMQLSFQKEQLCPLILEEREQDFTFRTQNWQVYIRKRAHEPYILWHQGRQKNGKIN